MSKEDILPCNDLHQEVTGFSRIEQLKGEVCNPPFHPFVVTTPSGTIVAYVLNTNLHTFRIVSLVTKLYSYTTTLSWFGHTVMKAGCEEEAILLLYEKLYEKIGHEVSMKVGPHLPVLK
jgi:hypothetical protein